MTVRVIIDLTDEQAAQMDDWVECAAARIVRHGDGIAALQLTDSLELITRPEGADRAA